MKFIPLTTEEQLQKIKNAKGFNVIFKHNTTCSISKGVKNEFDKEPNNLPGVQSLYILDLLAHRNISDEIAEEFDVEHQSPQLLLIKDGTCTYNVALFNITVAATIDAIENN